MTDGVKPEDRREHERAPIRFNLVYDSLSAFVSEFCGNISHGGVFVVVERPPVVGTQLAFSLRLADGFSLVQGIGEVVWSRGADEASERPAGMAVRFLELEDGSHEVIERILVEQRRLGQDAFEIGDGIPEVEPPASQAPLSEGELLPSIEEPVDPVEIRGDRGAAVVPPDQPEDEAAIQVVENGAEAVEIDIENDRQPPTVSEFAFSLMADEEAKPADREPRRLMPLVVVALVVLIPASILLLEGWLSRQGEIRPVAPPQEEPTAAPALGTASQEVGGVIEVTAPAHDKPTRTPEPQQIPASKPGRTDAIRNPNPVKTQGATRLLNVETSGGQEGTEILLVFDGDLESAQVRHERLANPPRLLIRVVGIAVPYGWLSVDVEGPHLKSIRLGHHEDRRPPEQHAVLDLGSPGVTLDSLHVEGAIVAVRLN